jgi:hypothetical protein
MDQIEKPALIANTARLVKQAIADAVSLNRKLGAPVYVLRDGQIVDIAHEPDLPAQD